MNHTKRAEKLWDIRHKDFYEREFSKNWKLAPGAAGADDGDIKAKTLGEWEKITLSLPQLIALVGY
ncbi:MAG: hypothetical protein NZ899_00785 [Thermoguttaceae bacterium]|nr:hypothetical protein [Thermoguttaceae bacterium]MDW8077431.1 hypothetical protein [Thermoguttaceae bacterium]